jgi:hypothetical protein
MTLEHVETHNIISFYSAPDLTRLCSRKASDVSNWKPRQGLFRRLKVKKPSFYSEEESNLNESEQSSRHSNTLNCNRLDKLKLIFSKSELSDYTNLRIAGLSDKSINWLKKAADILWRCTKGEISRITANELLSYVLTKYSDIYAKRKVINFVKAFFRYLSKTRFDTSYQAFELYLELPKILKERKHVTSRVITQEDIENVLAAIESSYRYYRSKFCALFLKKN